METPLLKILDRCRGIFTLLKIDFDQLRAIVAIKLKMDNRRQAVSHRRKNIAEPKNTFLITLIVYGLFGGIMALVLTSVTSFILSMTIFFSYIMVMVVMTLITDFSAVLLDTSDNTIILPRPVDSRTLFLARSIHILLYIGQITLALSIFPCISVGIRYGIVFLLAFIALLILTILLAVSFTNIVYLLVLQFSSEEKLKSVINYFQIIMAVVAMGAYQLVPRLMGRVDTEVMFAFQWWHALIPPVWMAGALETLHFHVYDTIHIIFTLCAVVVPVACFHFMNRYLTPIFSRKLGAMGGGSGDAGVTAERNQGRSWIDGIAPYITRSSLERGAFEIVHRILARDRKLKLKLYPAFGYVLVFGVVFQLGGDRDLTTVWQSMPESYYYLVLLYLVFLVPQVALFEIAYSDDFKASWIYFSLPIERPGEILSGMLRAIMIRLFVPAYIVISIFVFAVWGVQVLDDILLGFFNNLIMLQCMALLGNRFLPLSMAPNLRGQTGNFVRSMLVFVIVGALGVIHFLIVRFQPLATLGLIPIQIGILYWLVNTYRKTTWNRITV